MTAIVGVSDAARVLASFETEGGPTLHFERAEFTWTRGVTPSFGTVTLANDDMEAILDALPLDGALVFQWGEAGIRFDGCRLEALESERTADAFGGALTVRDRRWRWALGGFLFTSSCGGVNPRDADGNVLRFDRSARQLAGWCLETLSVAPPGYDDSDTAEADPDGVLAGLPAGSEEDPSTYPFVEADGTPAAEVLEELCAIYGCHVCPGVDGYYRLLKPGQGEVPEFGDEWTVRRGLRRGIADAPESVVVIGAPELVQVEVPLVARVPDTDGTLKDPDATTGDEALSFRPENGWNYDSWRVEDMTADAGQTPEADLIRRHLYRLYVPEDDIDVRAMTGPRVAFTRAAPHLVDEELDDDGRKVKAAPFVKGSHVDPEFVEDEAFGLDDSGDPEEDVRVKVGFRIDTRLGGIVFHRPVYAISEGAMSAASLTLVCAFRGSVCYREVPFAAGTPGVYRRAELPDFQYEFPDPDSDASNQDEMDALADAFAEREYEKYLADERAGVYAAGRLEGVGLSGRVTQVRYVADADGMETEAAVDCSPEPYEFSDAERRALIALGAIVRDMRRVRFLAPKEKDTEYVVA